MREREMFYLKTHSTHFIYGYMASDIWLRTILIVKKETRCRHIGYSYRLTARVLLYARSHRQHNTYHGLCYTSCGLVPKLDNTFNYLWYISSRPVDGMRNDQLGHPTRIDRRPTACQVNTLFSCPITNHWSQLWTESIC